MSVSSFIDCRCLISIPFLLSAGQSLFKRTSESLVLDSAFRFAESISRNSWFWVALFVYGAATLLWIFALSHAPLSRAMSFAALTFAIVPVIDAIFLREELNFAYWIGVIVGVIAIVTGVAITVTALDPW